MNYSFVRVIANPAEAKGGAICNQIGDCLADANGASARSDKIIDEGILKINSGGNLERGCKQCGIPPLKQ